MTEVVIRILLVEDNPDLSRRLTEGLRVAGFVVDQAADGRTAYELGRSETFDAAILDLAICRTCKGWSCCDPGEKLDARCLC